MTVDRDLYEGVTEYSLVDGQRELWGGRADKDGVHTYSYALAHDGTTGLDLDLAMRAEKITFEGYHARQLNEKQYELADHLGNVRAVVGADLKKESAQTMPYLVASNHYYPFGASMSPLSHNSGKYRFGFQGQETDNEIKGNGNSINFKYRMHDPRIGRFFAVDPLTAKYPFYSPYAFSGNQVINAIEIEGLEPASLGGLYWTAYKTQGRKGIDAVNKGVAVGVVGGFAAGAITSEVMLWSGISWGSLPAVQTYVSAAGTFTLLEHTLAGVFDAGGQYAALRMNNDHIISVSKINWTSVGLTFINPGSKVGVLTFNSIMANSLKFNFDEGLSMGEMNEVINGTIGDLTLGVTVGKIGNGVLSESKELSSELSGMLNKYVQHVRDGNMEAAEGAWKYFQKSAAPYLIFKYGTEPSSTAVGQGVKNAAINSANEKTKKD